MVKYRVAGISLFLLLSSCSFVEDLFRPSDIDQMIREEWGDIVFSSAACNPTFFLSGTNQSVSIICKTSSKEQILEVKANLTELGGGEFKLNPDYTRTEWSSVTFVDPGSLGIKNIYLIALNSKGIVKTNKLSVTVSTNESIIYVSLSGSDQNIGTLKGAPVKSFAAAISLTKSLGIPVIYIAGGNYSEVYSVLYVNLRLENVTNLSLYGGWNQDFTARDISIYPTVIDKVNNPNTGIAVIRSEGILLDGITVKGYDVADDILNMFLTRGGGILARESTLTLRDVKVIGCEAVGGGGMLINQSAVFMTNVKFISNSAAIGGGIYIFQSDPQIAGCEFNYTLAGGAMFVTNESNPYITNCSFSYNTSGNSGGAICYVQSFINLYDCMFANNSSAGSGGAVFMYICSNGVFYGNTFAYNSSSGIGNTGGGAVGMKDCPYPVEFFYNNFTANRCDYGNGGGAIVATNCADLVLADNNFYGNSGNMSADFYGCAVYFNHCVYQVIRNDFINNGYGSYNSLGGAFSARFSKGIIFQNLFDGNYAYNLGGAIFLVACSNSIASNQFKNNHVYYTGGALYANLSFIYLSDNIWISNYAGSGGAVYYNSSIATNLRDTFIDCWSTGDTNCIVLLAPAYNYKLGYTFISNFFALGSSYGSYGTAFYDTCGNFCTNTLTANIFATNTMNFLYIDRGGRFITNNDDIDNINDYTALKNYPNSTNNRVTNW
jgi:predicted outer membrane repeat protein